MQLVNSSTNSKFALYSRKVLAVLAIAVPLLDQLLPMVGVSVNLQGLVPLVENLSASALMASGALLGFWSTWRPDKAKRSWNPLDLPVGLSRSLGSK